MLLILSCWHRKTEGDNELVPYLDLGKAFAIESVYSFWSGTTLVVPVPQLSVVIGSPRIQGALSCKHQGQAALGDLKVEDVQLVDTLDSMRSVELTEDASAPDKELLVNREGGREGACSDFDHP